MHTYTKKIYYHDTDCGGVVYYANYLKYLEEARTEYLAAYGITLKELSLKGVWFVVKHTELDYKAPARYADTISVSTQTIKVRNVSLEFYQEIKKGDVLLVIAKTTLVCIDSAFKPSAIDESITNLLPK